MKEKKARVEDALHATRAAVEEGIVVGGGVALLRCREAVARIKGDNDDQSAGIRIVLRALEEPLRMIVYNAGEEPSVVMNKIAQGKDSYGYNALTGEYGDLVKMGVLDPTKVTRFALQNAASVAGLILTTAAMVAESPTDDSNAGPGMGMEGMGEWAEWVAWACSVSRGRLDLGFRSISHQLLHAAAVEGLWTTDRPSRWSLRMASYRPTRCEA